MALWRELKQRNVVKVGTVYLAAAWLIAQIIDTVNEPFDLPDVFATIVLLVLAFGFPIALIIAWAYELTPEGIRRTEAKSADASAAPAPPQGRFNVLVTVVLALAVTVLAVDRFVLDSGPTPTVNGPAPDTAPTATGSGLADAALENRIRVAVLPLRTLSTDESLAYFADGLSEQLILDLKQIPELLVPDRAASFALRDSNLPLHEIASLLGVTHVLQGFLSASGETLGISAALTRVADGEQLWQTRRDFERAELFDVQDEIRAEVATALSVSLGVLVRRSDLATTNIEAYTAFLTGLGYARRFTEDSLREAIIQYQRAIALDQDFFAPRIALYFALVNSSALVPESEGLEARREANEVLALLRSSVPDLAAVRMVDAARDMVEGNWAGVGSFLAEKFDPSAMLGDESQYYALSGTFLLRVGRVREAIRHLETARALAPGDGLLAFNLAAAYQADGRLDAALAEVQRGRAIASDSAVLAGMPLLTALARRDPDVLAQVIADANPGLPLWQDLGALIDDPEAGIAEVRRRFQENVEETPLAIGLLAHWANYFGAPELALEIVRSLQNNAAFGSLMIWDYGMRDARRLPEFKDLVAAMGLLSYWREYGWPDFCGPVGDDFECD